MFVIWSGGNNVTLSPRLGRGTFTPQANPEAQVTLLEGSGISADGVMTANIRCDSCLSWEGGSMSPTDGGSSWIWSMKRGSPLNSADVSANFPPHDVYGGFTLDLPAATSGDSSNPFLQTATTTQGGGASQPSSPGDGDRSSAGASEGSSVSTSDDDGIRSSHGIIMAVVFLFLFPLGALTMYLTLSRKTLFIHAPIQLLSVILALVGMVLGGILGSRINEAVGYHQIIGYIVVACLVLFQPALGLLQHLRFRKYGKRTNFGYIHQWLGRFLILLGIINGGLGLHIAGPIGSENVPTWSVIAYSVIAAVMGILYIAVVFGMRFFRKPKAGSKEEAR